MKSAPASHLALLFIATIVFCWSGWRPHDRFTRWLEIAPGLAGIIIFALMGAVCALLLLSHFHDRAIRKISLRTR